MHYLVLALFFLGTLGDIVVGTVTASSEDRLPVHLIYFAALCLMCLHLFYMVTKHKIYSSWFVTALFLWLGLVCVSFLLTPDRSFQLVLQLFKHIYWGIAGIYFYQITRQNEKNRQIIVTFFTLLVLLLAARSFYLLYTRGFDTLNLSYLEMRGNDDVRNMMAEVMNKYSYMTLWMLPLLLFHTPQKRLQVVAGIVGISAIFLSLKHGTNLSLGLSLIMVFLYHGLAIGKLTHRQFVLGGFFCLCLMMIFCFSMESFVQRIQDKMERDKLSSGRTEFWMILLKEWKNAPVANQILGHGFYQVAPTLGRLFGAEFFAHSDWVETLYDYGLLGIFFLINLHASIISRIRYVVKSGHEMAKPLIMAYCVLFFPSIVTITIMGVPQLTLYCTLGVILGTIDRHVDHTKKQKQIPVRKIFVHPRMNL